MRAAWVPDIWLHEADGGDPHANGEQTHAAADQQHSVLRETFVGHALSCLRLRRRRSRWTSGCWHTPTVWPLF